MALDSPSATTPAEYLAFAHKLADAAAAAVLPHFRSRIAVDNKAEAASSFDPVTEADRAAERAMLALLEQHFPGHGVYGEEFGKRNAEARHRWVLDPIDGTRAFITGSPLWGTLIGLLVDGRPSVGMMDQPFTTERFWSDGRSSLYRHGAGPSDKPLRTRSCGGLAEAALSSTHPDLFAQGQELESFLKLKSAVRLTRYGGDCYSYCMLAAGHLDLVVEAGLAAYDVVALIPIIEGAGGVITTWDGKPAREGGRIVAAGDARLHAAAMSVLAQ